MPESCDVRGCIAQDVEAVLVDGEHRLLCSSCQEFFRDAGKNVVAKDDKRVTRLAMFLHNEFCKDLKCDGVGEYMGAATRLLPKIDKHLKET
jgi:hypothetical protein